MRAEPMASPPQSLQYMKVFTYSLSLNIKNIFFPPQTVTFHLSFIWTCLVHIGFVKYITKSFYLKFRSFQTACNLIGQRRPLLSLGFLPPELTLSSALQLSSEFITDYLFLLAESRQRWDCRAQLLKGSSFTSALILILTYLVLLWKSCLPEIRQINKWYPEYRVHKIGCRNLGAKI